jgi:dienelactone hydrolase
MEEHMKPIFLALIGFFILFAYGAEAAVKGEEVEYQGGGVTMKGYIAYDDAKKEKRPGILVVHEWWGHNEYSRKRARMLAELGYTALAVDMYGNGKTASHPEDAGKFADEASRDMNVAQARFMAALDKLKAHPTVDANRIGAIGYCFGGGVVVEMARRGVDHLKAVVSFHGNPTSKTAVKPGQTKAKILVAHGADDQFLKEEALKQFESEMKAAGVDARVIVYPGAKHSFTNPDADKFGKEFNLPLGYNADADKKSWEDMKAFFKEAL